MQTVNFQVDLPNAHFLSVVKPFWRSELTDQTVQLGKEVVLHCDADGSPKPTTRFEKVSKHGRTAFRD